MTTEPLDRAALIRDCVAPFYEAMAGTDATRADAAVIDGVRSCARRISARDVARLLVSRSHAAIVGAWYAAASPRPDLGPALLIALGCSAGEGAAPPLLAAILDHVDMDAVPIGETADVFDDYHHRDLENSWGAAGLTRAAADVFTSRTRTPNHLPPPDPGDIEVLQALRAVARRLRA